METKQIALKIDDMGNAGYKLMKLALVDMSTTNYHQEFFQRVKQAGFDILTYEVLPEPKSSYFLVEAIKTWHCQKQSENNHRDAEEKRGYI